MTTNRRGFLRLKTRVNLVYGVLGTKQSGIALTDDLSESGVRFVAEHVLEKGSPLQLSLRLPDRQAPVQVMGIVTWAVSRTSTDKLRPGKVSEVGVQFVEMSVEDRQWLRQYTKLNALPTE